MPSRPSAVPVLLILVAATAVCLGSFARLYDADRMVVWHDEAFSLLRISGFNEDSVRKDVFKGHDLRASDLLAYQKPFPGSRFADTLASLKTHPEHSPLFFLLAWTAMSVSDTPLAAVRGTSAVLSLLLIPAVFWLAWELFKNARVAWIAAALAACSPLHLLYAQEARQYGLWTVLTAAASAALLRALRKNRTIDWAVYGILAALGLYTHLLFALVLAAHCAYVLYVLYQRRPETLVLLRRWVAAMAAASLLFSPWIAVVITRVDRVHEVTSWMERPIPIQRQLEAWGTNLVRVFADFPTVDSFLLLGLIPLAWVLWRFCVRAPTSARLFTCVLFLTFVAAVLVPDITQGGSRSLHPRYALPAFLMVQIITAYVLGMAWHAPSVSERIGARAGLLLVLGLGVWSGWLILQADTWWNKNFSADNRKVAAVVNAAKRPLTVLSDSGVGLGEVMSLAYDLDEGVVIRGEPSRGQRVATTGFSDIFLLTPSAELRAELTAAYDLVPILGTWQWYRAVPKPKGTGT